MSLVLPLQPHAAYTGTHPCETCSSSGQIVTGSNSRAVSDHLPHRPCAPSPSVALSLSPSLPPRLSLFVCSECLHPASLAWLLGGLPDKGRGGVSEGSEVNRKSGDPRCGRKGRVEGRRELYLDCVSSMWECCQPKVHSRSEFKTFSFYSFLSLHPFHKGLNGFEYFLRVMGG